jgi:hypothetical protein
MQEAQVEQEERQPDTELERIRQQQMRKNAAMLKDILADKAQTSPLPHSLQPPVTPSPGKHPAEPPTTASLSEGRILEGGPVKKRIRSQSK